MPDSLEESTYVTSDVMECRRLPPDNERIQKGYRPINGKLKSLIVACAGLPLYLLLSLKWQIIT